MRVIVNTQDENENADRIYLGIFEPPADVTADPRLQEGDDNGGHLMYQVLDALWMEWREINPDPESDSEFTDWLVAEKNWVDVSETLYDVTLQW